MTQKAERLCNDTRGALSPPRESSPKKERSEVTAASPKATPEATPEASERERGPHKLAMKRAPLEGSRTRSASTFVSSLRQSSSRITSSRSRACNVLQPAHVACAAPWVGGGPPVRIQGARRGAETSR